MTSKQIWIGVAVVVILTAVASIAIKSCSDKKPVVLTPTMQTIDSVSAFQKAERKYLDSLKTENSRLRRDVDSLAFVSLKTDNLLQLKNQEVRGLVTQASLEKKYKDTSGYLSTCDTLLPRVTELTEAVDNEQKGKRAAQSSYDSLLSVNSLTMARQDFDITEMNRKYNELAATAKGFEKLNTKLSRPKRLVGYIGAGYSFDGFKLRPSAHLGVGFKIFQF